MLNHIVLNDEELDGKIEEFKGHLVAVLEEIEQASRNQVRVYQIVAGNGFRFMTTSKDIFLFLGAMSYSGLGHLADLLKMKFDCIGETSLVMHLDKRDLKKDSCLVTLSVEPAWTTFVLSPAH